MKKRCEGGDYVDCLGECRHSEFRQIVAELEAAGAVSEHDAQRATRSARLGQEIVITLQTIRPGQYETPRISSSSLRFEGSYFPKQQNPGGPRQVCRFISVAVGEAKVEIPQSHRNTVYQITVQVKPD
jgi:hypothetical protein